MNKHFATGGATIATTEGLEIARWQAVAKSEPREMNGLILGGATVQCSVGTGWRGGGGGVPIGTRHRRHHHRCATMGEVFVITLRPARGIDGVHAIRALLKLAGRALGLRCIRIEQRAADE